jgi:NitT/TauT family transport system substrate-binding protein
MNAHRPISGGDHCDGRILAEANDATPSTQPGICRCRLGALLAACGGSDDKPAPSSSSSSSSAPEATSKREVSWTFQTGWFAQVESAAILTPMLYNTLPPNIELTVKDGGPGQTPINSLAVGQLDMASVGADNLLFSRDQGMPLKVIMSPTAQLPIAFVAHKEANVKGFDDFKNRPVATSNGTSYWDFMRKKYGLNDANKRTYTGSMAVWLQDKSLICQCIATNEPYATKRPACHTTCS